MAHPKLEDAVSSFDADAGAVAAERRYHDPEYPFLLTTERCSWQFKAITALNAGLRPNDTVAMAPVDADRLQLSDGEFVRLVSRFGDAVFPVRRTAALTRGRLFATFRRARRCLDPAITPERDAVFAAPGSDVTRVRIERISPRPQRWHS